MDKDIFYMILVVFIVFSSLLGFLEYSNQSKVINYQNCVQKVGIEACREIYK